MEESEHQVVHGSATLYRLAMLVSPPGVPLQQVFSWKEKTNYLLVALGDLPAQLKFAREVHEKPGQPQDDTDVFLFDAVPEIRLMMALEFTSHAVYSLAEIAAQVANKVTARTRHSLPASFNDLCTSVRKEKVAPAVVEALGDLSWYGVVREMRTEWTHFSAPFVTTVSGPPRFRVYSERPSNQKHYLSEPALFTFDQYKEAINGAVRATERLAGYLITDQIVPALDRASVRDYIVKTPTGFPVIRNSRMVIEKRTVEELLRECGLA
jgi:hypothetical protein